MLIIYCYEDEGILLLGIDHFCGDNPFSKLVLDHSKVNRTSTTRITEQWTEEKEREFKREGIMERKREGKKCGEIIEGIEKTTIKKTKDNHGKVPAPR